MIEKLGAFSSSFAELPPGNNEHAIILEPSLVMQSIESVREHRDDFGFHVASTAEEGETVGSEVGIEGCGGGGGERIAMIV